MSNSPIKKESINNEQPSILKKLVINKKKDPNQQVNITNKKMDSNQEVTIDFEKYLDKFFIKFDKAPHPFGIPKENYKIFQI